MKTTKSLTFMQIIILLNCLILCMLPTLLSAQGTEKYKFTNGEDADATDLHIEFIQDVKFVVVNTDATEQIPAGTFPSGIIRETLNGNQVVEGKYVKLRRGAGGNTIPPDSCITLTFEYTGNRVPDVLRWWWTKDNSLESTTAGRLGDIKRPRKGEVVFISAEGLQTAGDGSILLSIDGESNTFQIPPNLSNTDAALAFKSFVEDQYEFGEAVLLDEAKVEVYSRAHKNEIDDILVTIFPDSAMEIGWTYIPEVIPTLSEWGVIILILLTLAVGMVFLYRRQTALALAGNIQVGPSASKPKLFDKRLYAKVFGVVLLIGLALLGLAYFYFGEITSADPLGTFVSSAIVAYMVHFWMLRKMQTE